MRVVLGIVMNPSEVNRTLNVGVRAQAGQPRAPFQRFPGIQPNDYRLARNTYSWYTPVHHGWIVGRDKFYPQGSLSGAATAAMLTTMDGPEEEAMTSDGLLRQLVEAESLKAKMAVVSASAVVLMAIIGVVQFVKNRE